jgi:hypothetical protein
MLLHAFGSSAHEAGGQAQAMLYSNMLRQSNMLAFSDRLRIVAFPFLRIIALVFLMRKTVPVKGPLMVQ